MNSTCQAKQPILLEQEPEHGPVISYGGEPIRFLVWQFCGAPAVAVYFYCCERGHERIGATCPDHEPEPGAVGCSQCVVEFGEDNPATAILICQ